MSNYRVSGESLTAVANAIRSRAGTEDALVFPDGFVGAVEGIPDLLAGRLNNTLTSYASTEVTALSGYVFRNWSALKNIDLPNVWDIGTYAFTGCTGLTSIYLPSATVTGYAAFESAKNLTTIDFPIMREIRDRAFISTNLTALILRKTDGVCTLSAVGSTFNNTPIASGTGYIYVPRALVDSYKSATNWSTFANQIRAIEDYPEITGG